MMRLLLAETGVEALRQPVDGHGELQELIRKLRSHFGTDA